MKLQASYVWMIVVGVIKINMIIRINDCNSRTGNGKKAEYSTCVRKWWLNVVGIRGKIITLSPELVQLLGFNTAQGRSLARKATNYRECEGQNFPRLSHAERQAGPKLVVISQETSRYPLLWKLHKQLSRATSEPVSMVTRHCVTYRLWRTSHKFF